VRAVQAGGAKAKDRLLTMDPKEITFELVHTKLKEIMRNR
jgi:hypothetical protein